MIDLRLALLTCLSSNYIYKEESAIITSVTSSMNFRTSTITYSVSCTSKALLLNAGTYSFGRYSTKPSDEIKKLLERKEYGLKEIFTGMHDYEKVIQSNLIASNDKIVYIEPQANINVLTYLNYLVN